MMCNMEMVVMSLMVLQVTFELNVDPPLPPTTADAAAQQVR